MPDIAILLILFAAIIAGLLANLVSNQLESWLTEIPWFGSLPRRTKFVVLSVGFLVLALPALWINATELSPTKPPPVDDRDFVIAVSEFAVVNSNGEPLNQSDSGAKISEYVYDQMQANGNALYKLLPPDYTGDIPATVANGKKQELEDLAQNIKADVIVYGVITETGTYLELQPAFYVRYDTFEEGEEIIGPQALGLPITDLLIGEEDVSVYPSLRLRVDVLISVLRGLAYYHQQNFVDNYELAREQFIQALSVNGESEFDCRRNNGGQAIIHLLIAHTYLLQSARQSVDANLESAADHYDCAIALDPGYGRAILGQAAVSIKRALGNWEGLPLPKNIDTLMLDVAEEQLQKGLGLIGRPEQAGAHTYVAFNQAEIFRYRFYADKDIFQQKFLEEARRNYLLVIDSYNKTGSSRLRKLAANAYADLALITVHMMPESTAYEQDPEARPKGTVELDAREAAWESAITYMVEAIMLVTPRSDDDTNRFLSQLLAYIQAAHDYSQSAGMLAQCIVGKNSSRQDYLADTRNCCKEVNSSLFATPQGEAIETSVRRLCENL